MRPLEITVNYEALRKQIAEALAARDGEETRIKHYNEASGVIWPVLTDEARGQLVLR